MKKRIYLLLTLFALLGIAPRASAQYYGVRCNVLALATGTINAGFEVMAGTRYTLDVEAYWNPIKANALQVQVLAIQPGIRRWFYEPYAGHFVAAHLAAARYTVGNDDFYRKGWLTGVGLSYGYAWLLSKRWNLTLEAGVGLFYMKDSKRDHQVGDFDDEYIRHSRRLVVAPSKCEVTFTYLF